MLAVNPRMHMVGTKTSDSGEGRQFQNILEYEQFNYVPKRFSSFLFHFGFEAHWQCETPKCSGRLMKSRDGVYTVTVAHDGCPQSNNDFVTKWVGRGKLKAMASFRKLRNIPGEAKRRLGPRRPMQALYLTLPTIKEGVIAEHSRTKGVKMEKPKLPDLEQIISVERHCQSKVHMFLVQYQGIREPAFVPISKARENWPNEVLEFLAEEARRKQKERNRRAMQPLYMNISDTDSDSD